MPKDRLVDAYSVAVPYAAWGQTIDDIYSSFSYSGKSSRCNFSETMQNGATVKPTGIYVSYDLPESTIDSYTGVYYLVDNMVGYIRGIARVTDYTRPQTFNVYSQYVHLFIKISLNVEGSLAWKEAGISATASIVDDTRTYNSFNQTDYKPNAN